MYATQQQMIYRFGYQEMMQLTDRSQTGSIDADVMDGALADADAEINSYLASRYSLPLTQISPELVRLAADITRYRLYDVRASEVVTLRYENAIKKLRDVAKGVASLGLDQTSQPVAASGGAQITAEGKVFSRPTRGGW